METLVRERIVAGECSEPRTPSDLAKLAEHLFHYSQFGVEQTAKGRSAEMLQWLAEKQIDPFTQKSVAEYKRRRRRSDNWRHIPRVGTFWTSLAFAAFALSFGFVSGCATEPSARGFFGALAGITGVLSIVFMASTIAFDGLTWQLSSLYHYGRMMPEFALQTAVDIKSQFADAELFICELIHKQTVIDPFLVLRLPDGRELYLEVWNEPGFKKTREV